MSDTITAVGIRVVLKTAGIEPAARAKGPSIRTKATFRWFYVAAEQADLAVAALAAAFPGSGVRQDRHSDRLTVISIGR